MDIRNLIGKVWDTEEEMRLDVMRQLEGTVEFGKKQKVSFSFVRRRQEVHNDSGESYTL